jgi:hypothetical protein
LQYPAGVKFKKSEFKLTRSRFAGTGYQVLRTAMLSEMLRWTARFLLLVMLAPGFEPLAMAGAAHAAPAEAMHCMRQPMSGTRSEHSAQPAMQCHHAMAQSRQSESSQVEPSEASFHTVDNCCQNHSCCCCTSTPEWAQPASSLLSFISLLIDPVRPGQSAVLQLNIISGQDSARAPPRS